MAREHAFVVLTEPLGGSEQEYNEWYDSVHLDEIVAIPGITSARRYALSEAQLESYYKSEPPRYLAIYLIEGDAEAAFDAIAEQIESGEIVPSPAINTASTQAWNFTAIGEAREAPDDG